MVRSTTNGVLKSYRYNLQRSTYTQNKARDTVLTQRNFNSFAEDPAAAARAFQLRRSYLRTQSQHAVGESVVRKYDVAWDTLESVIQDVDNRRGDSAFASVLKGEDDSNAGGRTALGQTLTSLADSIVHTMNGKYGDNFVFAGADGLNVPLSWEGTGDDMKLCYRGIPVDTAEPPALLLGANGEPLEVSADGSQTGGGGYYLRVDSVTTMAKADFDLMAQADQPAVLKDANGNIVTVNENGEIDPAGTYYLVTTDAETVTTDDYDQNVKDWAAIQYMVNDEVKYADLGFGLQKDENGDIISSSVADVALQAIDFLGYGKDKDGDPKNIVSLIQRMGVILENCDSTSGEFASTEEEEEFYRLAKKFEFAADELEDKHAGMDTQAAFLQGNQIQLENTAYTAQEQFMGIEDADLADAITAFSWAQYCYNAALKVGNSVLSESLMDYLSL